ncbi:hypothetical protein Pelo_1454 [Pelomyxa schiedti]|nr:hypothetical protein Pelo_1454 [Pelomyxa schiedti]
MEGGNAIRHILDTSRVVWDNVVAPGWLGDSYLHAREPTVDVAVDVFRAAGAMFPLVALACSRVLRRIAEENGSRSRAVWAAGMAGSGSCVSWIVSHHHPRRGDPQHNGEGGRRRRSTVKEAGWVLCGLCDSGNVAAARSLFGGGGGGAAGGNSTSGSESDGVGELRNDVLEYVKSGCGVKGGHGWRNLEGAKWLASALGVGAGDSWVFPAVMRMALRRGCMDVAKWVVSEFDVVEKFPTPVMFGVCTSGDAPENVKWCVENFPSVTSGSYLLSNLIRNERCTVELCQWLRDQFPEGVINAYTFASIRDASVGKWALSTSPTLPRNEILNRMCKSIGNVSFVEWLVTERNFTPTAETFFTVCSTPRGGSGLPQWLSTRVKLSPADIQVSLERALRSNNTAIADWLEGTYGVMGAVNSHPEAPGAMLVEICREFGDYEDPVDGLIWFLQHLEHREKITGASVHEAIAVALYYCHNNIVLHLLKVFPEHKPQRGDTVILGSLLPRFVESDNFELQRLVTLLDCCSLFTRDMVTNLITADSFLPTSGKTVKWFIMQFHLEDTDIKLNHNSLLFCLLRRKKINCFEWLIDSFGITLDEVIDMIRFWLPTSRGNSVDIDLQTWKMILHKFPRIDADVIRKHFMLVAVNSPSVAAFTMHKFRITIEEIRCQFQMVEDRLYNDTEFRMWLG